MHIYPINLFYLFYILKNSYICTPIFYTLIPNISHSTHTTLITHSPSLHLHILYVAEYEKQRVYDLAVEEAVKDNKMHMYDMGDEEGEGERKGEGEGGYDGEDGEGYYEEEEEFIAGEFVVTKTKKHEKEEHKIQTDLERSSTECAKDYRGRYYYEKFKILPGSTKSVKFFSELKEAYLGGLMWCLAYYVKGCISWTWYFPYHYGILLQVGAWYIICMNMFIYIYMSA